MILFHWTRWYQNCLWKNIFYNPVLDSRDQFYYCLKSIFGIKNDPWMEFPIEIKDSRTAWIQRPLRIGSRFSKFSELRSGPRFSKIVRVGTGFLKISRSRSDSRFLIFSALVPFNRFLSVDPCLKYHTYQSTRKHNSNHKILLKFGYLRNSGPFRLTFLWCVSNIFSPRIRQLNQDILV